MVLWKAIIEPINILGYAAHIYEHSEYLFTVIDIFSETNNLLIAIPKVIRRIAERGNPDDWNCGTVPESIGCTHRGDCDNCPDKPEFNSYIEFELDSSMLEPYCTECKEMKSDECAGFHEWSYRIKNEHMTTLSILIGDNPNLVEGKASTYIKDVPSVLSRLAKSKYIEEQSICMEYQIKVIMKKLVVNIMKNEELCEKAYNCINSGCSFNCNIVNGHEKCKRLKEN